MYTWHESTQVYRYIYIYRCAYLYIYMVCRASQIITETCGEERKKERERSEEREGVFFCLPNANNSETREAFLHLLEGFEFCRGLKPGLIILRCTNVFIRQTDRP